MLANVRRVIVARIDWMREEGDYDMRSIRWFVESLSSAADVLEAVRELDGEAPHA